MSTKLTNHWDSYIPEIDIHIHLDVLGMQVLLIDIDPTRRKLSIGFMNLEFEYSWRPELTEQQKSALGNVYRYILERVAERERAENLNE